MLKDLLPSKKKDNSMAVKNEHPFQELHREMNRLFENFFDKQEDFPSLFGKDNILSPKFDISETDDAIQVTAELPGIDEKELDVSLDDNVLTIKGEKKEEHEKKKKNYHLAERSYGTFQRSFSLPSGIDREKIKAQFKKGVLNLSIPKTEEAKAKQKKIKVTSS